MKNYVVVNTQEKFDDMMLHIAEHSLIAYDVETNGLNTRKNIVIGISVCGTPGESYYLPLQYWDAEEYTLKQFTNFDGLPFANQLTNFFGLLAQKRLAMWNGSFDIRMTKSNFGVDLTDALYIDGMLAKHTVDEERPFGLKEVSIQNQEALGLDVQREANQEQLELKAHLESIGASTSKENYELYKGDPFIIGAYACMDTDLTLRNSNLYIERLREAELHSFFFEDEVMPLYKEVTIPMESKGIPLDIEKMSRALKEITEEMEGLRAEIQPELDKLGARYIRDFLDKKFPIDKKLFRQKYIAYFDLPLPKTDSGAYSLAKKELEKLPESNHKDFLLDPKDIYLNGREKLALQLDLYAERNDDPNVIKITSNARLGTLFFDYLDEEPLSYTEKGKPQFDDDTLRDLSEEYPVCALLRDFNKLDKIRSTYIVQYMNKQDDGIFYPSYRQHGTVSGRYGSDLQQLPRPKGENEIPSARVLKYINMVREFFVCGDGYKFIDADYEQLELHVFSHVSGDENLREMMRKGYDLYAKIGIEAFGLNDASPDKQASNYLKAIYPEKRQAAKEFTLGVPYGMKAWQLSKILDTSEEKAQQVINNYLGFAPKLKQYMEDSETSAYENGYVRSEFGRVRHLSHAKAMYSKFGKKLQDHTYRWQLWNTMGRESVDYLWKKLKADLNAAKNQPIQMGAASIVNRAAIAISKEFRKNEIRGYICAQVHDQLIMRVDDRDVERAKVIVQDCMENTTKISVPLKAEPQVAVNFKEGH